MKYAEILLVDIDLGNRNNILPNIIRGGIDPDLVLHNSVDAIGWQLRFKGSDKIWRKQDSFQHCILRGIGFSFVEILNEKHVTAWAGKKEE